MGFDGCVRHAAWRDEHMFFFFVPATSEAKYQVILLPLSAQYH